VTARQILLSAFAIAVFAVLFVPIPTIDLAIDLPPAPSAQQIAINRGILGALIGIAFVVLYVGLRSRRPPRE
jgi:hypothetical protein